jgi:hypothetical protein
VLQFRTSGLLRLSCKINVYALFMSFVFSTSNHIFCNTTSSCTVIVLEEASLMTLAYQGAVDRPLRLVKRMHSVNKKLCCNAVPSCLTRKKHKFASHKGDIYISAH